MSEIAEICRRLEKLEKDMWVGNGKPGMTTRMAVVEATLETQTAILTAINHGQESLKADVATMVNRTKSWDKAAVLRGIRNWLIVVAAVGAMLIAYLTYHHTFFPHEPIFSFIATARQIQNAGVI